MSFFKNVSKSYYNCHLSGLFLFGIFSLLLLKPVNFSFFPFLKTGTRTSSFRNAPESNRNSLLAAEAGPQKKKVLTTRCTSLWIEPGDIIRIDNLRFDSQQQTVIPQSARSLERIIATLKVFPSLSFEIGAHTDSRGDAESNRAISQKQAQAVIDYLVVKGIAKSRLKAKGYGESSLLNGCRDGVLCTEAEHRRNQRIEFKVLTI